MPIPPSEDDLELFSAIMRQIWLNSGVKRTTFRRRFSDLDHAVNGLLTSRFSREHAVAVHDWAASDCMTSAEWAGPLLETFAKARFTASDIMLYLMEVVSGKQTFILQSDGAPLQVIRPPFVIRLNPPEPRPLVVNYLLYRAALRKLRRMEGELKTIAACLEHDDRFEGHALRAGRISLVHPEAAALSKRDGRFSIVRHSAFEALAEPADVIRTMNIFNRAYFSPARLLEGARAVAGSLRPGGLWIVGRSFDNTSHAHDTSVLEWDNGRFILVARFGGGSEIESIALSPDLTTSCR